MNKSPDINNSVKKSSEKSVLKTVNLAKFALISSLTIFLSSFLILYYFSLTLNSGFDSLAANLITLLILAAIPAGITYALIKFNSKALSAGIRLISFINLLFVYGAFLVLNYLILNMAFLKLKDYYLNNMVPQTFLRLTRDARSMYWLLLIFIGIILYAPAKIINNKFRDTLIILKRNHRNGTKENAKEKKEEKF